MNASPLPAELALSALTRLRQAVLIADAHLESPGPTIRWVNDEFTRATGWKREELVGQAARMISGRLPDLATLESARTRLARGQDAELEATGFAADGDEHVVRWHVEPLLGADGQPQYLVAVRHDVSAERQRTGRMDLLDEAVGQLRTAVLVCDALSAVTFANRAVETHTGYAASWLTGQRLGDVGLLPASPTLRAAWRALRRSGRWRGAFEARRADGHAVLLGVSVTRLERSAHDQAFVVLADDITERRRLEAVAQAAEDAASLGLLFAALRHEIGNPLNSIQAALSVVRRGLTSYSPERLAPYLDGAAGEIERVAGLLASFRRYQSFRPAEPTALDAVALCDAFEPLVRPQMDARGVAFDVAVEPLHLRADPDGLRQVLLNLTLNAIDAVAGRDAPRIELRVQRSGHLAQIDVLDNGHGFDPARAALLFQPFVSTKPHGSGIGLAVCRRLVAEMGGTIEAHLRPQAGSCFRIRLPLADDARAERPPRGDTGG